MRATIVRPGPDADRHGHGLGPRGHRPGHRAVGGVGLRPPLQLHASRPAWPHAIAAVVGLPRGTHATIIELQPEAPITHRPEGRGTNMTTALDHKLPPRVSGGEEENGHLEELRVDPIALMRPGPCRVRRRRGVPPGPAGRGPDDRRGGQRVLLPRPGGGPRPGRGLSVHDAGVRRGRGLRRPARAPAGDAPQPGAAGQVHAGARRHHRRRGRADGGRLGRRGRDRPARLVRRADHLHLVGLPDREAVPQRARQAVRRALPRPRAGHRRHRLRRPLRPHRELPPPGRGPGGPGRAGRGDHEEAGRRSPVRRRGARPARRAHVHQQRGRVPAVPGRRGHRHVHLHDVRRPPHHLGHGGVDPDRAAPPPRRASGRGRSSWPSCTPAVPRSATRPSARCPTSSRPSRRPSGSTLR